MIENLVEALLNPLGSTFGCVDSFEPQTPLCCRLRHEPLDVPQVKRVAFG
jgi:hypothetical protein